MPGGSGQGGGRSGGQRGEGMRPRTLTRHVHGAWWWCSISGFNVVALRACHGPGEVRL